MKLWFSIKMSCWRILRLHPRQCMGGCTVWMQKTLSPWSILKHYSFVCLCGGCIRPLIYRFFFRNRPPCLHRAGLDQLEFTSIFITLIERNGLKDPRKARTATWFLKEYGWLKIEWTSCVCVSVYTLSACCIFKLSVLQAALKVSG